VIVPVVTKAPPTFVTQPATPRPPPPPKPDEY
jgi:hypothetical protein